MEMVAGAFVIVVAPCFATAFFVAGFACVTVSFPSAFACAIRSSRTLIAVACVIAHCSIFMRDYSASTRRNLIAADGSQSKTSWPQALQTNRKLPLGMASISSARWIAPHAGQRKLLLRVFEPPLVGR
jgi:hypothetical protein